MKTKHQTQKATKAHAPSFESGKSLFPECLTEVCKYAFNSSLYQNFSWKAKRDTI